MIALRAEQRVWLGSLLEGCWSLPCDNQERPWLTHRFSIQTQTLHYLFFNYLNDKRSFAAEKPDSVTQTSELFVTSALTRRQQCFSFGVKFVRTVNKEVHELWTRKIMRKIQVEIKSVRRKNAWRSASLWQCEPVMDAVNTVQAVSRFGLLLIQRRSIVGEKESFFLRLMTCSDDLQQHQGLTHVMTRFNRTGNNVLTAVVLPDPRPTRTLCLKSPGDAHRVHFHNRS